MSTAKTLANLNVADAFQSVDHYRRGFVAGASGVPFDPSARGTLGVVAHAYTRGFEAGAEAYAQAMAAELKRVLASVTSYPAG